MLFYHIVFLKTPDESTLSRSALEEEEEKHEKDKKAVEKEKKSYDLLINLGASFFHHLLSYFSFFRFIVFPFRFASHSYQIAYKG